MQPATQRFWYEKESTVACDTSAWVAELNISPFICHLLCQRSISSLEAATVFLRGTLADLPDPMLLCGMELALARIVKVITAGEKIAIHGDYDVDGITGTALLTAALTQFGAKVDYHIPLRLRDGYGLSETALKQAAEEGITLIISVDCGISALAEADQAAALGLDLIITDHHQPLTTLPRAVTCINPWLSASRYPFKQLSGVGVAFMLIIALRARLRSMEKLPQPEPDIRYLLDLVAMGTIADIVPLHGVNRILVKSGLRLLEQGRRVGVRALKEVADVKRMSAGAVGFKLAPRLNAAGRLEDAALGVRLLLSEDSAVAATIASQVNSFNSQRQKIEAQVLSQALEMVVGNLPDEQYTIVLADERWHSGVIGIVASRLVEMFHRPTVLIALEGDRGKGSARSIRGFHLFNGFQHCGDYLSGFGGHEYAAGLSIKAANIDDFSAAFEQYARATLSAADLQPIRNYDAELLLQDIDRDLMDEINALEPFGAGNPQPLLLCCNVKIQKAGVVGEKHLRFTVQQDGYSHPAIAFGMAERIDELSGAVDILFNLSLNVWRERETLQLQVKDFRPAQ
ncbi:MAG: single-stranded-DNA-specific exonuclease RecJ [Desulfuromonas sp.]|nr:single-stranded-DNA-specific exonuclease RecJ [Desulfuromonas sp.]